jgi:hypothetical protein
MTAFQVIKAKRGRKQQAKIGEFEYHPEHFHWHLVEVAAYRLLDGARAVIRSSEKVSFCLIDTNRMQGSLPGSPLRRRYFTCSRDPRARSLRAGVSVGWADIYTSDLPGQWVDITGLPSGSYTLQVEVNPGGILAEKTRENNIAEIPVAF